MRRLLALVLFGLAVGAGLAAGLRLGRTEPPPPDAAAVVTQVREVARLEAMDVTLYKKISYAPEPTSADTLWGDVAGWLRHVLRAPRGKAIVFAEAHLGLDLDRLGPASLRVDGREAWLALPPMGVRVELRPGDTEIIGSNLDSAETARLFELARAAFEREVAADLRLRERARRSAERAIHGLLLGLGFREVHFVDVLPGAASG